MLYSLARPLLFCLDPERAHALTLGAMRRAGPLVAAVVRPPPAHPTLLMGLELPNPVGLAAGLDKNGEYLDALAQLGFGFIEIGTVTPRPQPGNPTPRMFRLTARQGLINRLGFNNKGLEFLLGQVKAARYRGVLGINIGKNFDTPNEKAAEDYLKCLRAVHPYASYITVNISSPNTRGLRELQHGSALKQLLETLLEASARLDQGAGRRVPLALKVAPDHEPGQLQALIEALNETPPAAVIATNTTIDRSAVGDLRHASQAGGLSGAPLLPRANEVLRRLRQGLDNSIELIGVGGITRGPDAVEKMVAGAAAVQIYTGLIFRGPRLVAEAGRAIHEAGA